MEFNSISYLGNLRLALYLLQLYKAITIVDFLKCGASHAISFMLFLTCAKS